MYNRDPTWGQCAMEHFDQIQGNTPRARTQRKQQSPSKLPPSIAQPLELSDTDPTALSSIQPSEAPISTTEPAEAIADDAETVTAPQESNSSDDESEYFNERYQLTRLTSFDEELHNSCNRIQVRRLYPEPEPPAHWYVLSSMSVPLVTCYLFFVQVAYRRFTGT